MRSFSDVTVVEVPRIHAGPWHLEIHGELGSTSDLCLERAREGAAEGLAILALRQTRGRGSRGRGWVDPGGNLSMSVLLRPGRDATPVGLWPFIAGLAFYDALAPWVGQGHALSLKWPNDLLLDGRKVAGILIEAGGEGDGRWLSLGMGANLCAAPVIEGRDLACMADVGPAPEVGKVASAVLTMLDVWMARYAQDGFDAIRTAWLHRAHPVGTPVRVVAAMGTVCGTFEGIGGDGLLLLRTPDGVRAISTGEVLLGTA
ncbi:biotin--[acetyl-CoA-carboxylase] ligase [Gluconacetobacter entanii]|uniref:biotin--[acetyl-CoA-carboxylase] ligase n=1 Tax=Gluconacetobacter entanii TaxID=108528 RepID=UPI001C932676|nr:biotin--[acetyl-CoA-carboxylase] ligase [Gluconacetobacter entanii]MBY4638553.1 biotin--[acetyl-CoA-carboxylase] ligase [Gluconacetobacter entanii]MCW4581738.1 biotin--[acetyl-CoA-carboxylase] ligase [Gluconacetobacter entanii]MCW4585144.1 biotin--[acetyl-CoA-carboxylase] ligase [Gluconacetobacter entanii]MCW4588694.1 biotin--[acetyl-CoA-carboxylase] ligase [Gluconacetobacter entanii]